MRSGQNSFDRFSCLRAQPDGVLLSVKLQPRSSVNEIGEILGGELRIKVTAPPVDAAANRALVGFLAEVLEVPRNRVNLLRGLKSRHKVLKLHGMTLQQVAAKLQLVQPADEGT